MAPVPTMGAKLTAEFIGTAVLMFSVGCNVLSANKVWGSTSISCALMVSIYALGGISGANFNPAVSVALGVSKAMRGPGMGFAEVGTYCIVQIFAAIVAGFGYAVLFWKDFNLTPAAGFGWKDAMVCEILYTFMLCFVVLNVAAAKGNTPNQFYGLAIGFVIAAAGVYGAGMASGGCFNPAVAIGIDASSMSKGFGWCIVFAIWELMGAVLAAFLFRIVRPEEFEGGEKSLMSELASEFLGTFMLVVTVGLNVMGRTPDGAFSIACSLTSMIYALGNVSGAHFNPAVTLTILCSGRCPDLTPTKAGMYMLAQHFGAMAAAVTYSGVYNGASFKLGPGAGWGIHEVAIAEFFFTYLLCYVVLCVAVSTTTKAEQMFGFVIGSCLTCGINAIGMLSGGAINPAVAFGIATGHRFSEGTFGAACWFSLFEFIGAATAAGIFGVTHALDKQADKFESSA